MLKLVGLLLVVWCVVPGTQGRGVLLLYRPRDVTDDCALSEQLRFDLSFGMGLSDTITLVLRTMSEVDYECQIDITTEKSKEIALLIVIRFPNALKINCRQNPSAFTILKKRGCVRLCEEINMRDSSPYFLIAQTSKFRFRFVSNSSINTDMQAYLYEVTATTARPILSADGCHRMNETFCELDDNAFCFTSGVVCDGILNCGVPDWFDERKSNCELPVEKLTHLSVIAVMLTLVCAVLAAVHIINKCLPPAANSFFIFNINEDNRLCIEPIFEHPNGPLPEIEAIDYSSSSKSKEDNEDLERVKLKEETQFPKRKNTIKAVTRQLEEKVKLVTTRIKITMTTGTDYDLNT